MTLDDDEALLTIVMTMVRNSGSIPVLMNVISISQGHCAWQLRNLLFNKICPDMLKVLFPPFAA